MTYKGLFFPWKQHVPACLQKMLEHVVYLQSHMAKYLIKHYAANKHGLFQTKICRQHDTVSWISIHSRSQLES